MNLLSKVLLGFAVAGVLMVGGADVEAAEYDVDAIYAQMDDVYQNYFGSLGEERQHEMEQGVVDLGEVSLPVKMQVKGRPEKYGYPVFLGLYMDDEQRGFVQDLLYNKIPQGICISLHWDNDKADACLNLYDRAIDDAVAFYRGNPDKVYIACAFPEEPAAKQIVAELADRLAGTNVKTDVPNIGDLNVANRRTAQPTTVVFERGNGREMRGERANYRYWLGKDVEVGEWEVTAQYNSDNNIILVQSDTLSSGIIKLYLTPSMMDLSKSVFVTYKDKVTEVMPVISENVMQETARRGDPMQIYPAVINLNMETGEAWAGK